MDKYKSSEESERTFKRLFEQTFHVELYKLIDYQKIDFSICRDGTTIGFCELKCRTIPFSKCDSIWISLNKFLTIKQIKRELGLTTIFVNHFPDVGYRYYQNWGDELDFNFAYRQTPQGDFEMNIR